MMCTVILSRVSGLLWRAPEHLRETMPWNGTKAGDVYSFAIILQEIITRSGPYQTADDDVDPKGRLEYLRNC